MSSLSFLIISILRRTLISGTPLLLGTLGEIYTERAGILNLGIEGLMAVGAVTGFSVAYTTSNPWLGLIAAILMGALLSSLHAFVSITLKANQTVSGLALTMLGTGLSGIMGRKYVGIPLSAKFDTISIPLLSKIPFVGPVFFKQDIIFYLSIIIGILFYLILYKTQWGIQIRSVGENPLAADSLGISVIKIRYITTIIGGAMAGMAGAHLSLVYIPSWIEGMVAGRGWIVIALTIFAGWNPAKAFLGAYLFGGIYILQYMLQPLGISPNILLMLPYLTTLIVLFFGVKQSLKTKKGAPATLGFPYIKGEK